MIISHRRYAFGLVAAIILVAAGCGGSGTTESTGRISLGVSDGPVHDAFKVCVAFSEIEFKSGADSITETLANNVNLLDFQGANAAPLLFNYELPAGNYQWMRLGVNAVLGGTGGTGNDPASSECQGDASYIQMDTETVHNLYIPSGFETGLKLVGGFTVPAGGSADFTAEFDLMKSVTAPNGLQPDVILRPTIRLVNNVEVGTLTGEVSSGLATGASLELQNCDASVYVFNDGVTPNGIEEGVDDEFDPIATAMVEEQVDVIAETTEYHYTVGYLLGVDEFGNPPGNYEVAFTCDGERFVPVDGKPVEIFAGQVTEVNFL